MARLIWRDPDPLPDCCNVVKKITHIDHEEGTAYIEYGDGSEAEIFISELWIEYKKEKNNDGK